jgi:soluble lytic murein transglycosylase-like protein
MKQDTVYIAYLQMQEAKLEEGKIANTLMAVGAAGAIAGIGMLSNQNQNKKPQEPAPIEHLLTKEVSPHDNMTKTIIDNWKLDPVKAKNIVDIASRHAKPDFPQTHHLLAIAAIESGFRERAVSKLKKDPAVGAMQIRPGVWKIDRNELMTLDGAFKHGSRILHDYYKQTGDMESAIKAYNIGITAHKKGQRTEAADRYHEKFKQEISNYKF